MAPCFKRKSGCEHCPHCKRLRRAKMKKISVERERIAARRRARLRLQNNPYRDVFQKKLNYNQEWMNPDNAVEPLSTNAIKFLLAIGFEPDSD